LFLLNTKQYKLKNQTTFVEDNVFFLADYLIYPNTSNNNNTKVKKRGSEKKRFLSLGYYIYYLYCLLSIQNKRINNI